MLSIKHITFSLQICQRLAYTYMDYGLGAGLPMHMSNTALRSRQSAVLSLAAEVCNRYRLIADYFQRPQMRLGG